MTVHEVVEKAKKVSTFVSYKLKEQLSPEDFEMWKEIKEVADALLGVQQYCNCKDQTSGQNCSAHDKPERLDVVEKVLPKWSGEKGMEVCVPDRLLAVCRKNLKAALESGVLCQGVSVERIEEIIHFGRSQDFPSKWVAKKLFLEINGER